MLSTIDELAKGHMNGSSSPNESLLVTDESFIQEFNKEIRRHFYAFLHAFLNLHDS